MRDYVFLLGRGRSGTTWVGRLLNTWPRCQYKYEPFNPGKSAGYEQWMERLRAGAPPDELRMELDRLTEGCEHQVDYPPFVRKSCRPQSPLLLRLAWQLGKVSPALRGVYHWYGRPRFGQGDSVLIKQVNFPSELLERLAEAVRPRIIGMIRNPFASVASAISFYARRQSPVRSEGAVSRVRELLMLPGHEHLRPYGERLDQMPEAAFEALRWRIQTEPLVSVLRGYDRGMVLQYEAMAERPVEQTGRVFSFLGWPFGKAQERAIEATSETPGRSGRRARSEFSIYRDSRESLEKWKRNLSPAQQQEVAEVTAASPLRPVWPELEPVFELAASGA